MAISDKNTRVTISMPKEWKSFLDKKSDEELRNTSNLILVALTEKYGDEYKKFLESDTIKG